MKAAVVTKPNAYEIIDMPIPALRDEYDVLIRVKAAGVCGSDPHLYHGENPMASYPRILGHENAGVVARVGDKVTRVKVGDRVVVEQIEYCGKCYPCRIGRQNVCENLKVRGGVLDGGFREYFPCSEKAAYVLPDNVSFEEAALVEPFTIGAQATSRGRVEKGDVAFILGAGTIGSTIVQFCRLKGAATIVCDIAQDNLNRAKTYGADYLINSRRENVADRVRAITDGKGVMVAFDAACFQGSLTSLFAPGLVRNAGRSVTLGFTDKPESITQAMIAGRELDVIASRLQSHKYPEVIRLFAEKEFKLEGLVTHRISFRHIDQVFYHMDHPDPLVKKMMVVFD